MPEMPLRRSHHLAGFGNVMNKPWVGSAVAPYKYPVAEVPEVSYQKVQNKSYLEDFLMYMKWCGLYFDNGTGGEGSSNNVWKVYSFMILLTNFVSFLVFLVPILIKVSDMEFGDIAMMSCMLLWTVQNCVNAASCFCLSYNGRFRHGFLQVWEDSYSSGSDGYRPMPKVLSWTARVALCMGFVICTVNQAAWIYMCFDFIPDDFGKKFFPLLLILDESVVCYLMRTWGVLSAICTPAWPLPTILFVLTGQSFIVLFTDFSSQLRKAFRSRDGSGLHIETFRLQYEQMVEMVQVVDHEFSIYTLSIIVTTLALTSLMVYRMIFYCTSGLLKALEIAWFVSEFGILLFVSWISAMVNTKAHQSLGDLYSVSTHRLSCKSVLQMSLFIDRLSANAVGFSGWGFFFINKGFIMTLISGFFTYFFLLLQFGGEVPSKAACMLNNTFTNNTY